MTMMYPSERQVVVDLCRALADRGHFAGTGGNIALRLNERHIAVTPSATDYQTLRAVDVCVLNLADLARVDGEQAPSVESGLHARVLRARPEVGCSIHTHQPVASACALLGQPLAVPPRWRATLGPQVPLVGYAPSGSGWLAARLARALRPDVQAYLMRNHGILCCGASPADAMQAVEDLEALAHAHLMQRLAQHAARQPALGPALARVQAALGDGPATTAPDPSSAPGTAPVAVSS